MAEGKDLLAVLWSGADVLRGKMDANEYKTYLLGLVFYKYLSDSYLAKVYDLLMDEVPESLDEAQAVYEEAINSDEAEDLLEEIVGELRDEYDIDEEDLIKKISDTDFIADGSARLDEINEATGLSLEADDIDSIAGYIIRLFERIPKVHETISDENASYTVLRADQTRIDRVKIHVLSIIQKL